MFPPSHVSFELELDPDASHGSFSVVSFTRFLRVPTLATNFKLWNRLLSPGFSTYFEQLFGIIATRTTKARVADEMRVSLLFDASFPPSSFEPILSIG